MTRHLLLLPLLLLLLLSAPQAAAHETPQPPKREFRGAWIATVWGIDWPSVTGSSPEVAKTQRKELSDMLQQLADMGINAVFFHVRPMADALYRSSLEPWSAMLTGQRGVAPADGWDPLQFCVDRAHELGMECHAWINPFRFIAPSVESAHAFDRKARSEGWALSMTASQPKQKAHKRKGSKRKTEQPKVSTVLNPANPAARAHIVAVCREIAANYDIDGIVFDDYFYPHGLPLGSGYDYDQWLASGSQLSQADWRRQNVNTLVRDVHAALLLTKPYLRFGISPAGVAGNDGLAAAPYGLPRCHAGHDWMYDGIFCDPLAWLADGTVDYVSPQIYWSSVHDTNPYEPIARWWTEVATHFGRHCFPSVINRAFSSADSSPASEAALEVCANRLTPDGAGGTVFYSAKPTLSPQYADVRQRLVSAEFAYKALPPAISWRSGHSPGMVEGLKLKGDKLRWDAMPGMRFAVYAVPSSVDTFDAFDGLGNGLNVAYLLGISYTNSFRLPKSLASDHWYAVSPLDRYGREWETSILIP